jgi:hypothetical protein
VDEQTFDRWAVDMSQRPTRRATLRLIAGDLLGGLLSWRSAGLSRAQDACGGCPAGYFCRGGVCLVPPSHFDLCLFQGLDDCGGVCIDLREDDNNCGACGVVCSGCSNGQCPPPEPVCIPELTNCGGICTDLARDEWNCGACGNSCPIGSFCEGGACVSSGYFCTTLGLTECFGHCVDPLSDPDFCGGCQYACYRDGARCVNGACV